MKFNTSQRNNRQAEKDMALPFCQLFAHIQCCQWGESVAVRYLLSNLCRNHGVGVPGISIIHFINLNKLLNSSRALMKYH
jgi:hypothetical protein